MREYKAADARGYKSRNGTKPPVPEGELFSMELTAELGASATAVEAPPAALTPLTAGMDGRESDMMLPTRLLNAALEIGMAVVVGGAAARAAGLSGGNVVGTPS